MALGLVVVVSVAVVVSLGARVVFDVDERRSDGRANPTDPHRPAIHFSAESNWAGAPSGVVTLGDRHHLFFQHNPGAPVWGDIGWGHAVSDDLVTWSELDMARPATETSMVFPGSVVTDRHDTSGLCPQQPCLAATYTVNSIDAATGLTRQDQHLATSLDGGATWEDYAHNPVLALELEAFRDPNVFWHAESSSWIMTVALPIDRIVRIYRSDDLRRWEHASDFGPAGAVGGAWECPVLIELPLGATGATRWVLKVDHHPGHVTGGSGAQYFVGHFDGSRFVADEPDDPDTVRWVDRGPDFWCAMPFRRGPEQTVTWIGWLNNWMYAEETPTDGWRGAMSLPRSLGLDDIDGELHLVQAVAAEFDGLRGEHVRIDAESVEQAARELGEREIAGDVLELRVRPAPRDTGTIGLRLRVDDGVATTIEYDAERAVVRLDRSNSTTEPFHAEYPRRYEAPVPGGTVTELHIVVDRSSIEVFADGVAITALIFPPRGAEGVELYSHGDDGGAISLDVWTLSDPAAR
jgi:fructan beta-fructosidase